MSPFPLQLRAAGIGLVAVALTVAALPTAQGGPPTSSAVPPTAGTAPPAPPTAAGRSVTLITGDRVRILGDQRVQPEPGPGRTVTFSIHRTGGHVSVIPSDALALLGTGRLDPRLFDVTELVAAGYDDTRRKDLPLIITYDGAPTTARAALQESGATAQRDLPAVNGRAAHLPKAELSSFFADLVPTGPGRRSTAGIAKVWLDGKRTLRLDHSVPQIGAPAAWAAGATGRGVKVAVLDSGVDATHPDFAGRLQAANFSPEGPEDANGHATHVASIVAGSGAASNGRYKGVAPDAELLSGKVCVADGCADSWILAGMDWAVQQGAKVVNISLGGYDAPGLDPLEQAVNTLTARSGALFVVAAGNSGPSERTIDSPGSAAAALTVGAVDRDDQLADFSSRGPTVDDGAPKPDLTAPGVDIVAAKAAGSQIGEPVGTEYLRLSGTSMATPHVAGVAALLAQRHPDWKADRLKAALMGSAARDTGVRVQAQGSGRVDAAKAVQLPVTADAGVLAFGMQRWPRTDDVAESKDITYTNTGATPLALELSAAFTAPDGQPAPASAVRLSASTVTIPARGTATVTVTSDTRHDGPDGRYVGELVATAGTTTFRTTLSVHREQESYDLTVKHLDRAGAATADYLDILVNRDAGELDMPLFLSEEDGTTNIRLPKGRYLLDSTIGTERDRTEAALLVQPQLNLTRDQVVTMDARQARPVSVSTPEPTARNVFTAVEYELGTPAYAWSGGLLASSREQLSTAQVGQSVPELSSVATSQWARPDPNGGEFFNDTPYLYALAWPKQDGWFTGLSKTVRPGELATIRPTIARHAAGTTAVWTSWATTPTIGGGFGYGYPYEELPAGPVVHVTTQGVEWAGMAILRRGDATAFINDRPAAVRPGRTHRQDWAKAVLGPGFPRNGSDSHWASRSDDVMELAPPQSDSDGHYGQGITGSGTITVSRDGEKVGVLPYPFQGPADTRLDVPPGRGRYQVDVETAGTGLSELSTAVRTSWTFESGTELEGVRALPLWALRFTPAVDDHNVLRTGRTHLVPVVAQAQSGSAVGTLRAPSVQASTDDGKTWRTASVRSTGAGRYVAVVTVPQAASYVSLRARAADSRGNTVEQEITRAYKTGR
ncbi:peptidase S8 and S53 subtilisin kexin sedolisin [Kribbella flavida DSM 17836]|uniref:Peptidase S8 and S53 subtilisin kexin sedolisin n=1 Tax=Kribbella flavida (strain DSM 17836 / JCM 10339 / NBRC 14399) TaxID=479435 RepID=D2PUC5_KRIFD|nr:S8 family peptidase [Kribbella flavida]ADB35176.1 peptidase S8 and S53 subtilisin kexin sedolisin [Kribbella flavida DSM 17836]